jgi:hypothetical protein
MSEYWVVGLNDHMSDVAFFYHKTLRMRKRYPDFRPHHFTAAVEELIDWLCENMEKECDIAYLPDGKRDFQKFFFRSKDDAMKFKLRWGGEYE